MGAPASKGVRASETDEAELSRVVARVVAAVAPLPDAVSAQAESAVAPAAAELELEQQVRASRRRTRQELWSYYHDPTTAPTADVVHTSLDALANFGLPQRDLLKLMAAGITTAECLLSSTRQKLVQIKAIAMRSLRGNLDEALLLLPEEILIIVMSYCRARELAALCATCKGLCPLAAAELRGHRNGVSILSDANYAPIIHWIPRYSEQAGAVGSAPSVRIDLCGLYVKRPQQINGCNSYFLAGKPQVMLWKCDSQHWVVGLKDAHGQNSDSCFMEGNRDLLCGRQQWKLAQFQRTKHSWQFVPTSLRVLVTGDLLPPGRAKRAVNRYEDTILATWGITYQEAMELGIEIVDHVSPLD